MVKIAPSILSADFSKLGQEICFINDSDAEYVHIDVMDGHFVPNISFGPVVYSSIRGISKKQFDVHLMIENPRRYVNPIVEAGADIVSIHTEINDDVIDVLKLFKAKGVKTCVVYKPETSIDGIERYFDFIDQVLLMSVSPGFSGQFFNLITLKKIENLDKLLLKYNIRNKIDIEIDGGINVETGKKCLDMGADVLVMGSAFFSQSFEMRHQIVDDLLNYK